MADETFANFDGLTMSFRRIGEGGEQDHAAGGFRFHLVEDALLRVDERSKFREQHASHGGEFALTLQHAGEAGEVGLEPILFRITVGGEAQVVDHGVDVVFEFGDFTAGVHLNRAS